MSIFTRQEKLIAIFLCACLIIGIFVMFLKKNIPYFYNFLSLNEMNTGSIAIIPKQILKNKSNIINQKVNINSASLNELINLPHIGEKIAKKIIEMRQNIKFKNINDLKKVHGIGNKKAAKLEKYIDFDTIH